MSKKIGTEFIDNFLVVWDPKKGSELYRLGYYGKPIGISKPKVPDFDVPLILDLMEGLYLVEKGEIMVSEGLKRKNVSFAKLRKRARKYRKLLDIRFYCVRR